MHKRIIAAVLLGTFVFVACVLNVAPNEGLNKENTTQNNTNTENIKEKLPHNPTADIFVSPNCPIMIWSTIENDACSILCNVTGIAILHNDFINFDIIISSYFPFLSNQPVTRFLSYILHHLALPPDIQLLLSPLSLLPDESL